MLGFFKVICWSIYFFTFLLDISKANSLSIYYEMLGMYLGRPRPTGRPQAIAFAKCKQHLIIDALVSRRCGLLV